MAKKQYQVYIRKPARGELSVREATQMLNRKLGGDVVKIVHNKSKADATIGFGLKGTRHAGYTTEGKNKDRIRINASAKDLPKEAFTRTVAHEIGHGLGMEHRSGERNLMNPDTGGRRLKKGQKKRVKRAYRKGDYS